MLSSFIWRCNFFRFFSCWEQKLANFAKRCAAVVLIKRIPVLLHQFITGAYTYLTGVFMCGLWYCLNQVNVKSIHHTKGADCDGQQVRGACVWQPIHSQASFNGKQTAPVTRTMEMENCFLVAFTCFLVAVNAATRLVWRNCKWQTYVYTHVPVVKAQCIHKVTWNAIPPTLK